MITVIILLVTFLNSPVLGERAWERAHRGQYVYFNIDDKPLELETSGQPDGYVELHFSANNNRDSEGAVIHWTVLYSFEIESCELENTLAYKEFPNKWAIVKTYDKLQIYCKGKPVLTVDKYTASRECQEKWWPTDHDKTLKWLKIGEKDTATRNYRSLRESMCPPTHHFVFSSGDLCCNSETTTAQAHKEPDPLLKSKSKMRAVGLPACENEQLQYHNPESCCGEGNFIQCKEPPCMDYVYQDHVVTQEIRYCRDRKYDPYGVTFRGEWNKDGECVEWRQTPLNQGDLFDWEMGLNSNNCRNPDQDDKGPWCFVMDKSSHQLQKETCYVPYCDFFTVSDAPHTNLKPTEPTEEEEVEEGRNRGKGTGGEEEKEDEEERALQLFHPYLSSEYTLGYHGAQDAIDGNFDTFAHSDDMLSSFEAWLSFDKDQDFFVRKVIVYTHSAFQDRYWQSMYYEGGLDVSLWSNNPDNLLADVFCSISPYILRLEKYEFTCSNHNFLKTPVKKVVITNRFGAEYPVVMREVEVYGSPYSLDMDPSIDSSPDPDTFIEPPMSSFDADMEPLIIVVDPEEPSTETDSDSTIKELRLDSSLKLNVEMDLKRKVVRKISVKSHKEQPQARGGEL